MRFGGLTVTRIPNPSWLSQQGGTNQKCKTSDQEFFFPHPPTSLVDKRTTWWWGPGRYHRTPQQFAFFKTCVVPERLPHRIGPAAHGKTGSRSPRPQPIILLHLRQSAGRWRLILFSATLRTSDPFFKSSISSSDHLVGSCVVVVTWRKRSRCATAIE